MSQPQLQEGAMNIYSTLCRVPRRREDCLCFTFPSNQPLQRELGNSGVSQTAMQYYTLLRQFLTSSRVSQNGRVALKPFYAFLYSSTSIIKERIIPQPLADNGNSQPAPGDAMFLAKFTKLAEEIYRDHNSIDSSGDFAVRARTSHHQQVALANLFLSDSANFVRDARPAVEGAKYQELGELPIPGLVSTTSILTVQGEQKALFITKPLEVLSEVDMVSLENLGINMDGIPFSIADLKEDVRNAKKPWYLTRNARDVLIEVLSQGLVNGVRWVALWNTESFVIFYLHKSDGLLMTNPNFAQIGMYRGITVTMALVVLAFVDAECHWAYTGLPRGMDPGCLPAPGVFAKVNDVALRELKESIAIIGSRAGSSSLAVCRAASEEHAHSVSELIICEQDTDLSMLGLGRPLDSENVKWLSGNDLEPMKKTKENAFLSDATSWLNTSAHLHLGEQVASGSLWEVFRGTLTFQVKDGISDRAIRPICRCTIDMNANDPMKTATSTETRSGKISRSDSPHSSSNRLSASTTSRLSEMSISIDAGSECSSSTPSVPVVIKVATRIGRRLTVDDTLTPADRGFSKKKRIRLVRREQDMLEGLLDLQGKLVPKHLGTWRTKDSSVIIMALEDVGPPLPTKTWTRIPDCHRITIIRLYKSLHAAGVVHNDAKLEHICAHDPTDASSFRLVSFTRAREANEERTTEEQEDVGGCLTLGPLEIIERVWENC